MGRSPRFCIVCPINERKTSETFSRHSFPKKDDDPVRREAWLNFVKQARPNVTVVDSSHYICGAHFAEDCFAEHPGVIAVKEAAGFSRKFTRVLKSDAVPTIISVKSDAAIQKNQSHLGTSNRDKRIRIRNIRKELRELKKMMTAKAADRAQQTSNLLAENRETGIYGVQTDFDSISHSADKNLEYSVDGMNMTSISAGNLKLEYDYVNDSKPSSIETVDIKSDRMQIFHVNLVQGYTVDTSAEIERTSFVDESNAGSGDVGAFGKAGSESGATAAGNNVVKQLLGKESVLIPPRHNFHATHIFPPVVPRSNSVPLSKPLPTSVSPSTPIRPLLAVSPKTTSVYPVRMFCPQQILSSKPPCVDVSVWTEPCIKRHWGVQVGKELGPHKRSKGIRVNMPCGCASKRLTAASIAVQCDIWSDGPSPSLAVKEESPEKEDELAPDKQVPSVSPAHQEVLGKENMQQDLCMKIEIPFRDSHECEEKKDCESGKGSAKDSASTMSPVHYVVEDNECEDESTLIDSSRDDCSEGKKRKLDEDNDTFDLLGKEATCEVHGSNTQLCMDDNENHSTESNGTFVQSCVVKEDESIAVGEKPYECRYCAKVFSRLVTMKTHQHRCPKNRPYKCQGCNKSFTHLSTLKMHQLIHT